MQYLQMERRKAMKVKKNNNKSAGLGGSPDSAYQKPDGLEKKKRPIDHDHVVSLESN